MNPIETIRQFHRETPGATTEQIDAWLSSVREDRCTLCGGMWRRWEFFNGRCNECRLLEPDLCSPAACGCVGVDHSQQGWHFVDGVATERCPAYWRAAGYEVVSVRVASGKSMKFGLRRVA